MINFEKLNIFKIEKAMKNEMSSEKENGDERPYTFKITKRRSPWTTEEDEAITALVNKYGTGNWTLIANEMSNLYGFKTRSGKQCRERWHNHLDPCINKDYWSEKEENILFMKHMEYGNKWSDIAKFLPGRTDNAIKNHFYSKLRKFIRKILKQINKDNLLKTNGVDPNKYNSDRVYKMIKKNKIPYNSLNKDTILSMIVNFEKNNKTNKGDSLLSKKTQRKKQGRLTKENLYSEKVNKRYLQIPIDEHYLESAGTARTKSRNKNNITSLYSTNINTRSKRGLKRDILPQTMNVNGMNKVSNFPLIQQRSRRNIRKKNLREDYIYDNEDEEENEDNAEIEQEDKTAPLQVSEENGKDLISRNLNIIINKSVLFKNFVKEEEERSSASSKSAEKKGKQEFTYGSDNVNKNDNMNNRLGQSSTSSSIPSVQPIPLLNPLLTTTSHNNIIMDDRLFRYDSFPYMDPTIPLISPINPNAKLYPPSTRNYFNIEMPFDGIYPVPLGYNLMRPNPFSMTNFATTPTNLERIAFNQSFTPNKEISMHNKILINDHETECDDARLERTMTPSFKQVGENAETEKKDNFGVRFEEGTENVTTSGQGKKIKKPSLDLNLVNTSETGRIFTESVANSFNVIKSSNANVIPNPNVNVGQTTAEADETPSSINKLPSPEKEEEGSVTNISDRSGNLASEAGNKPAGAARVTLIKGGEAANLTISPKSAFVKMK